MIITRLCREGIDRRLAAQVALWLFVKAGVREAEFFVFGDSA